MTKHTPFLGWVLDHRAQAAVDAGHPEWAELLASPSAARRRGDLHYFTGKPCKHGHVSVRDSGHHGCVECRRADQRSEKGRKWTRDYSKTPAMRAWWKAANAIRRAKKLNATPHWLAEDQLAEMRGFYECAASRAEPHDVDHIIPLIHPDVCGLHVPWNLQVLTASENRSKGAAFDGTMENEGWRS
jgi:hypothetical protein